MIFIYPGLLVIAPEPGTIVLILPWLGGNGPLRRHRALAAAHP
jgi:hypothetical protein